MSELVEFAKTGNLAKVRECVLKDGYDVNFRCPPDGSTALYWAACSGHVSVCDWLINNGAEIDMATTKSGSTALHGASDRGHYDCVALLLRRGSEIDRQTTANGDTALHLAAYRGNLSVCRLLLDHDAGTTIANTQGRTALEESLIQDHQEVSRLIAQHNLFRERQGSLSDKIPSVDTSSSEFASAKDMDGSSEILFPTSCSQFSSEFADLHRQKLHSDDTRSLLASLSSPSNVERWTTAASSSEEMVAPTSGGCKSFDHLDLPHQDDISNELIRHLRTKISALESYTETLLAELAARDTSLERLRSDNALLRQQLDEAKASVSTTPEQNSTAQLHATSEDQSPGEVEELRRRCRELEQVVNEVSQELRNCDRGGGGEAPKDS